MITSLLMGPPFCADSCDEELTAGDCILTGSTHRRSGELKRNRRWSMEAVAYVWACSSCHVLADPGQRFCRQCGTAITPPPPIVEEPEPVPAAVATPSHATRLWLLFLALIAVLFLAIGGGGGLLLAEARRPPHPPTPPTGAPGGRPGAAPFGGGRGPRTGPDGQ